MPVKGEKVFYVRDERGAPMACVAFNKGCVAAAILHPNDKFDRKMARKIALGRLRKNSNEGDLGDKSMMLHEALAIVHDMQGLPKRISRRIKSWRPEVKAV